MADGVAELESNRSENYWGRRYNEAVKELDELKAFRLQVAQTVGIVYQADGHADAPGPDGVILGEVERIKLDAARAFELESKAKDLELIVSSLELSDPFRPRAGEVSDQILTHQEIQKAIAEGNLRVAPESGIGTQYESGPGFVTVEYAAKVIENRAPNRVLAAIEFELADMRSLLARIVTYAREDSAHTPGVTRLGRGSAWGCKPKRKKRRDRKKVSRG